MAPYKSDSLSSMLVSTSYLETQVIFIYLHMYLAFESAMSFFFF